MENETGEHVESRVIQVQTQPSNGLAIAALVIGIIGVVLNWIPFIPYILGLLAIIFGIFALSEPVRRGFSIAGIILGIVTFLFKIGFWIIVILSAAASA
ncbi:DUF4190 domain-containing protein [Pseudogracilibacillus sp. SE30717A]|uniref:DUF4190 domain-containing protein n=1 Tax=Pseudogracilibacillus sp. SE30717A TaxID=3098293 RepID=UPI00300DD8D7